MLGNMLNKKMMEKMQHQMEEVKEKLNNISVQGESEDGKIKVVASGNRLINNIELDEVFLKNVSKTDLENLILMAANRALEQAERVEKSEMSHAAMGMMPGMG